MKLRYILLVSLFLVGTQAIAEDDYLSFAREVNANKDKQTAIYYKDAIQAKNTLKTAKLTYSNDAEGALHKAESIVSQLTNNQVDANKDLSKHSPSILIFVSFSMPKESLEAYLRDAKKVNAAVVIRGLYDHSFKKTIALVAQLIKQSGGNGLELNPLLFRQFAVQSVPTVVVLSQENSCLQKQQCTRAQDADVIGGNIKLEAALELIRNSGSVRRKTATEALDILQGIHHV